MTYNTYDFLLDVVPRNGFACILLLKHQPGTKAAPQPHFVPDIAHVDDLGNVINTAVATSTDVYFAVNAFKTSSRKADDMKYGKTFFIDIDVGDHAKKYPTKELALQNLLALCKHTTLPSPTWIVDSGNGIHAYWVTDTVLDATTWQTYATRFKQLLLRAQNEIGLLFDHSVPADSARILRVPGTSNFKDPLNPKPVAILRKGGYTALATLDALLPQVSLQIPTVSLPAGGDLSVNDALGGVVHRSSSFAAIYAKSAAGQGCAQLMGCITEVEFTEEPLWRGALSIANVCVDREEAIRLVSDGHPDYQPHMADAKASETKGPYTCEAFNDLNPNVCAGCAHWGRVKSPIVLGHILDLPPVLPVVYQNNIDYVLNNTVPSTSAQSLLPYPYYRTTQGIYKELDEEEVVNAHKRRIALQPPPGKPTAPPTCMRVFEYDFAVTAVGFDEETNEEVYGLSCKLPNDPLRTQTMTSSALKSGEKFRTMLHMGAGVSDGEVKTLRDVVIASVKTARRNTTASQVVKQMGWTANHSFCFGRYELHSSGAITTVINRPELEGMLSAVRVKGDATVGVTAFKEATRFWSTKGYEYGALAIAVAFASPLLHLTSVINGGVVHCFSTLSGRGKSALQITCAAVWGDSAKLMSLPADTINSTMHHINMLGSIPMAIDEVTKLTPEETGSMIYQLTHGREKRRMDGQTYTNKPSMGTYRTLTITSGNASLLDKVMMGTTAPDGLAYRVLELQMDHALPDTYDMEGLITRMTQNCGAVGARYIGYVVQNQQSIKAEIQRTSDMLSSSWGFGKQERFWREMLANMIVGISIANRIGVAEFDIRAVIKYAQEWVPAYRQQVEGMLLRARDCIMQIIAANVRNMVFVQTNGVAVMQPGGAATCCYDHKSSELWISAPLLRAESVKYGTTVAALTKDLISKSFVYNGKRDMAPGATLLSGMAVNVETDGYIYKVISTTAITKLMADIEAQHA